ncbi:Phosphoglycerate mutase [Thioalkalivibrio sp. K90mix]|uniref:histidine phosphatase family protein n=1 Tax=unclassified Thioalkalivibrio TaxID=2621013 RepID=UPI000195AAB0|nr:MULTISPECIES: histidine phosphatase family protein [unclassified Thioalkalivibrio]ADC71420.1 Phosphoglycerate mutase [Thioalkalivibrio sp. K90mix]
MKRLLVGVVCVLGWILMAPLWANDLASERALVAQLQEPHRILLMRHAAAPGIGDPAGFELEDCSTQRNLSAAGREQAREIGERLRAAGLDAIRVFAGPWCRNADTARLLGYGEPQILGALGSIFRTNESDRERWMRAWHAHLAAEVARDAGPAVYVTHRANVMGLSGRSLGAGDMLVVQLDADGRARPVTD